MEKIKEYLSKKKVTLIVFGLFFILVFIQHQSLFLYHDDYGYASLSYAYHVDGVEGTQFSLNDLFEFLKGHYNVWGGRIVGFFFEIVLLRGGLWLYRLVQSIFITLIFFLIYKIAKICINDESVNKLLLSILTVSFYGFFEIMLFRNGIFWITASVLYVLPLLPMLAFVYLYNKSKTLNFKNVFVKIIFYIFCAILIFLATLSQEQNAIAMLGYIVAMGIYNTIKNKKVSKLDILMFFISFISFVVLMIAPGNAIRKEHPTSSEFYSQSLITRIFCGIENVIIGNFSEYTRMFSVIFFFTIAYIAYINFKEKNGNSVLDKISLISILIILISTLFIADGYFQYLYNLYGNDSYHYVILIIYIVQLFLIFYSSVVYLIKDKQFILLNLLIAALLSQACMIVAPYYPLRSAIIFQVICYIYVLYNFGKKYKSIADKKFLNMVITCIVILSFVNFMRISIGYYRNASINLKNDESLKKVSQELKHGNVIKDIKLDKVKNILYSGDQPYTIETEYIKYYIREYYDLPEDFIINYN